MVINWTREICTNCPVRKFYSYKCENQSIFLLQCEQPMAVLFLFKKQEVH